MMKRVPIFIAVVLASSAILTAEQPQDQENDALFPWPNLNNPYDTTTMIKGFECGTSIHNVYSCLRSSFMKFNTQNFHLLHAATDCCASIQNFRNKCSDNNIGKFEAFIFPRLLFKCNPGDVPAAPGPAPAAAAGPAADSKV